MAEKRGKKPKAAKAAEVVAVTGRRCPLCGRPAVARYRPFCSLRCAERDLGHWLNEDYRIATEEEADLEDEGMDTPDAPGEG